MKTSLAITLVTALIAALAASTSLAQNNAPAAGASAAAPGPGMGMGAGMGKGPGQGGGPGAGMRGQRAGAARWGADYTPGWALMSTEERTAHRTAMQQTKSYDECKALQEQHREQMATRAQEKGVKIPAAPRRDACAGLKK